MYVLLFVLLLHLAFRSIGSKYHKYFPWQLNPHHFNNAMEDEEVQPRQEKHMGYNFQGHNSMSIYFIKELDHGPLKVVISP